MSIEDDQIRMEKMASKVVALINMRDWHAALLQCQLVSQAIIYAGNIEKKKNCRHFVEQEDPKSGEVLKI